MTTFSRRTARHDAPNALSRAVARARLAAAGGRALLDLTASNPTTADLPYEGEALLAALGDAAALTYEPLPLGLSVAREAVAADYAASGIAVDASRVALTASTSEAYAVLFKMLCDPGDEILVPAPSYPLLDWLASFEAVTLRPYPLVYAGRWHVDLDAMARAVTPRTRAVVVVNPNNPTGSYLGREELAFILDLGLPVVSDEVFARYPLASDERIPVDRAPSVLAADRGLVFALSGLSKLVGLPQMKLGWIATGGDAGLVARALERLETVLDAYLSVGAPIQRALPAVLARGASTARAISQRTRKNLARVRARFAGTAATPLEAEGGWYAVLRVPDTRTDEDWAVRLVEEDAVYVHPGYFFDMDRGAHLVLSLLTPEPLFEEGIARVAARIERDA